MNRDTVENLMSQNVATCQPEDRLSKAAQIMWERDCGCVPVVTVEDGEKRVVGMLTDRDICMAAYTQGRRLQEISVGSAMSRGVKTCQAADAIHDALRTFADAQVHRLPVVDEAGNLRGVLSLADIAREARRSHKVVTHEEVAQTFEEIERERNSQALVRGA